MEKIRLSEEEPESKAISKGFNKILEVVVIEGTASITFTKANGNTYSESIDAVSDPGGVEYDLSDYVKFQFSSNHPCVIEYELIT
ncbi:hypothetical protein COB64_03965 [Candidatus Wolfebacteria bacterium]|nr:MAG: hypothetical protein COB64_03965 [Candidatus Wolfebacteria bacterium]